MTGEAKAELHSLQLPFPFTLPVSRQVSSPFLLLRDFRMGGGAPSRLIPIKACPHGHAPKRSAPGRPRRPHPAAWRKFEICPIWHSALPVHAAERSWPSGRRRVSVAN